MITCPVCGYDQLTEPLRWSICPSCGTQFGYSDRNRSYAALRAEWIKTGAQWDSPVVPAPPQWSAIEQLRNIGYEATASDSAAIEQARASNAPPPIEQLNDAKTA